MMNRSAVLELWIAITVELPPPAWSPFAQGALKKLARQNRPRRRADCCHTMDSTIVRVHVSARSRSEAMHKSSQRKPKAQPINQMTWS